MTKTIDVAKLPIESWDITKIVPYPNNAKKHSDEQTALLAKSIARVGIANPIQIEPEVFADGSPNPTPFAIIAGHGRTLAAKSLGWTHVPVVIRRDLTRAECAALRISDNQTVSTDYDTELLKLDLQDLAAADFEMDTLGFDEKQMDTMISDFGEVDEGVFVEDINESVETQKTENAQKAAEIDSSAAPVSDALGFKRVSIEQGRKIRQCMTVIEGKTGKQGVDALMYALEGYA